jgi:surface antigen
MNTTMTTTKTKATFKTFGAALALAATLGACSGPTGYGTKETFGTLAGAALGGWAGSTIGHGSGRLAATAAGVVLGGLIGNQIGRGLDEIDRQSAYRAQNVALERYPDGQQSSWDNPNSGNSGYTVPQRTYQTSAGQYCREYQTTIVVGGQAESGYGTACRMPDGSWEIVG